MLNLVTAFITSYETIAEEPHRTSVDFAVMDYYARKCNDKLWKTVNVRTTIRRITAALGSKSDHVRRSIRRLCALELLVVQREDKTLTGKISTGELIVLKPGVKLRQLSSKSVNNNNNTNAQSRKTKAGDSA